MDEARSSAKVVAAFFIRYYDETDGLFITNPLLNKLLYFAQGHCLVERGGPLFDSDVKAWECGSVVSGVYRRYRVCGKDPIPATEEISRCAQRLDEEDAAFLTAVAQRYATFTNLVLFHLVCKPGSPWEQAFNEPGPAGQKIISRVKLKSYFQAQALEESGAEGRASVSTALDGDWSVVVEGEKVTESNVASEAGEAVVAAEEDADAPEEGPQQKKPFLSFWGPFWLGIISGEIMFQIVKPWISD